MNTPNDSIKKLSPGELHLYEYLKKHGERYGLKFTFNFIRDFDIADDDTHEEIEQVANDFLSDCATEASAYAAEQRDTDHLDTELYA